MLSCTSAHSKACPLSKIFTKAIIICRGLSGTICARFNRSWTKLRRVRTKKLMNCRAPFNKLVERTQSYKHSYASFSKKIVCWKLDWRLWRRSWRIQRWARCYWRMSTKSLKRILGRNSDWTGSSSKNIRASTIWAPALLHMPTRAKKATPIPTTLRPRSHYSKK